MKRKKAKRIPRTTPANLAAKVAAVSPDVPNAGMVTGTGNMTPSFMNEGVSADSRETKRKTPFGKKVMEYAKEADQMMRLSGEIPRLENIVAYVADHLEQEGGFEFDQRDIADLFDMMSSDQQDNAVFLSSIYEVSNFSCSLCESNHAKRILGGLVMCAECGEESYEEE